MAACLAGPAMVGRWDGGRGIRERKRRERTGVGEAACLGTGKDQMGRRGA